MFLFGLDDNYPQSEFGYTHVLSTRVAAYRCHVREHGVNSCARLVCGQYTCVLKFPFSRLRLRSQSLYPNFHVSLHFCESFQISLKWDLGSFLSEDLPSHRTRPRFRRLKHGFRSQRCNG